MTYRVVGAANNNKQMQRSRAVQTVIALLLVNQVVNITITHIYRNHNRCPLSVMPPCASEYGRDWVSYVTGLGRLLCGVFLCPGTSVLSYIVRFQTGGILLTFHGPLPASLIAV